MINLSIGTALGGVTMSQTPSVSLGPELVPDPDFGSWTNDDPDGWIVGGESAGSAEVTEASPGFRMLSDGTFLIARVSGVLVPGGTYRYSYTCSAVSGVMNLGNTSVIKAINSTGSFLSDFTATEADIFLKRSGTMDVTLTHLSIRRVL